MNYKHRKCGGYVDKKTRTCERCNKKFKGLEWYTTTDLTPITESRQERLAKRAKSNKQPTSYAAWADSLPFVGFVAGHLPNWKRRWRVLSVLAVYGGLIYLVIWLLGTYPLAGRILLLVLLLPFISLFLALVLKYTSKVVRRS